MIKKERVMQKYSKEGIMVNRNLRKILKIHLQKAYPCSSHKEASIMIMIKQGINSEGLDHKEDDSLPGKKSYFPILYVSNIFVFLCRIFFISFYCQYCDL